MPAWGRTPVSVRTSGGQSDAILPETVVLPWNDTQMLERTLAELAMIRGGSKEGGFFVVIGRKPLE